MIDWHHIGTGTGRLAAWNEMRKLISTENYGFGDGQWSLTDMAMSTDPRRFLVLQILDGITHDCKRHYGISKLGYPDGTPMRFRFKVLTRQACARTGDGQTIFASKQAFDESGGEGILPDHSDLPVPGDIVRLKNQTKEIDPRSGRKVNAATLREWARRGEDAETWLEFAVDKDGCISVGYPHAFMMLRKHGAKIAYPKFKKGPRGKKVERKMTNWWFEEVPPNYKAPRSKAS